MLQVIGITNPLGLGFDAQALFGVNTAGAPEPVADEISSWTESSYVVVAAGRFDVLAELLCFDRRHLLELTNRVRAIPDVVSTETFPYLQLAKQVYSWGTHLDAETPTDVGDGMSADVRLEGVTKKFDEVTAVDDLTLEIESGKFYALLGPSGCGKTTTLRMIGGFEEPSSGTIFLGDRTVTGLPPHRRDVNTVFQSYALFPHLTIFENVAFGLRRKGKRGADLKTQVDEMLGIVGLSGYGGRKPRQLSGGQQQRVALARALVNHPRVLLLDEPLGALDLKLRKEMQLELKNIQREIGITFVHVTHDQEEAMTMADFIVVMNGGRIEQLGTPTELYEHPATAFVANFLGISNLLPGTVEGPEAVRLTGGAVLRVGSRDPERANGIRLGGHSPREAEGRRRRRQLADRRDRRARLRRRVDAVRGARPPSAT